MKVLWVFGWDDSSHCLPVLFKTSQGHVLVKFGDETMDQSFYSILYNSVGTRHVIYSDFASPWPYNSRVPEALRTLKELSLCPMELWDVLQGTDRSKLVFKEVYRRYFSKCENGWSFKAPSVGLPSPKPKVSPAEQERRMIENRVDDLLNTIDCMRNEFGVTVDKLLVESLSKAIGDVEVALDCKMCGW